MFLSVININLQAAATCMFTFRLKVPMIQYCVLSLETFLCGLSVYGVMWKRKYLIWTWSRKSCVTESKKHCTFYDERNAYY